MAGTEDVRLEVNRSGYWEIRWTDRDSTGRARTRTASCRTKDRHVAEAALDAWRAAGAAVAPLTGDLTVDEACQKYLDRHVDKRGGTDAQARNLVVLRRVLGDLRVVDLTEARVDGYVSVRRGSGIASGTVRRELGALRAVLNWAERKRLVPPGAVVHFDLPAEGAPRRRYLSEDEEGRLWDTAVRWVSDGEMAHWKRRGALFVCLALETAARSGAVRELKWDQIDWKRGLIDFGADRGNKRRAVVPISDRLRPVLATECARSVDEYVLGHAGKVRDAFEWVLADAGLADAGVTAHDLRRTWASLRVSWGVPLQDVAAVLGDSIEVVEKHYAVFSPDYLRGAVNVRGRAADTA